MKKKIKLFSSALAIGMLLGAAVPAITGANTPATSVQAKDKNSRIESVKNTTNSRNNRAVPVNITASDVTIDADTGRITDFTNAEKAALLLAGGELVIPKSITKDSQNIPITGIADAQSKEGGPGYELGVFDQAYLSYLTDKNGPGISKITFEEPNHIRYIGEYAFWGNQLTKLTLPVATEIGEGAFANNQLTTLNLPAATEIGEGAFGGNQLTTLNLPETTEIGKEAFRENALISINLNKDVNVNPFAFTNQDISHEVMPNKDGEIGFAALKPTLLKRTDDQIKAVSRVAFDGEESIELENGVTLQADNDNKKITGASHPVQYSAGLDMDLESEGPLPGDYSISSYSLTVNPFKENPGGNGGLPGNGNSGNDTDTNPDTGNGGGNDGNETKPQPVPKPEERRPHTVYAKRGMRLHRNVSLTSPIRSYKKQSRAKAASFRVRGIAYDRNGKKRYKVDGGYITAGSSYVADSHFRSNKVRQVRVLSNRVNSYKDVKLSSNKKVRSYKKGTKLRVKRVVNWGRATRFELTNGRYITGNKQLLIMDQK
ncbi:leucine-rich repeat domain-containing protein [Secundilactobacillus mixtipabuli]|uniref:DUF5776 domain-containing protein n=1 Tax=Secundilactobacillus mixtipabuli TaxID=1435342 RepID=A0A1Z5I9J0_9LACO|nr:leucine-rich repeat domain-containing protein [Secundilactobacillus mixtipabuli]GAW98210.1 hypothetical protein IWT30_00153 [Secundilactobacillus mixtipabuli]